MEIGLPMRASHITPPVKNGWMVAAIGGGRCKFAVALCGDRDYDHIAVGTLPVAQGLFARHLVCIGNAPIPLQFEDEHLMTSDKRKPCSEDGPTRPASRKKVRVGKRSTADPYGTDVAVKVKGKGRRLFAVSYWDLWMILLADRKFDADLDRLATEIRARRDRLGYMSLSREEWKGRLSHLRDLQRRLQAVDLDMGAVMAAAGSLVQQETRRAVRKVLEKAARQREWSDAMKWTPEKKGQDFALHGYWDDFPVSPQPHADRIAAHFSSRGFYTENQSFSVARRLDGYVAEGRELAAKGRHVEALALLRAVLTETIRVMGFADDSCGVIGDTFQEAFKEYLALNHPATGIDETVFLHDLLTLLIWEDYGLTDGQTQRYFKKLSRNAGQICIDFVRQQIERLQAEDLDYQAQEALTLLGLVACKQRRYDLFISLAREMKTEHWQRILRLADTAMKARKRDLALLVFEAALQPGFHYDLLRRYHEQLQRGVWKPDLRE